MSVSKSDRQYGYVEVIPTMCGDAFGMVTEGSDDAVPYFGSKKEIMDEIEDISAHHNEEIKNGERDPEDVWESYPQFCFIDGDLIRYCDPKSKQVIETVNWRDAQ